MINDSTIISKYKEKKSEEISKRNAAEVVIKVKDTLLNCSKVIPNFL